MIPSSPHPADAPESSTPTGRAQGATRPILRGVFELGRTVVYALLIAGGLRTLLVQPFTIPSSSMEPGLVTGDYILVSKFAYGWSRASLPFRLDLPGGRVGGQAPKRGDVVVFQRPYDPGQAWIKRVIGAPGDQIQVVSGLVRVNGRPLQETPIGMTFDHDAPARSVLEVEETGQDGKSRRVYAGDPGAETENTPVFTVPKGDYFVMGDNRDNSADSRFPADVGVGMLPAQNIIGKAEVILFSWRWTQGRAGGQRIFGFQADRFLRLIR